MGSPWARWVRATRPCPTGRRSGMLRSPCGWAIEAVAFVWASSSCQRSRATPKLSTVILRLNAVWLILLAVYQPRPGYRPFQLAGLGCGERIEVDAICNRDGTARGLGLLYLHGQRWGSVCYARPQRNKKPPVSCLGVEIPCSVRQLHGLACVEGTSVAGVADSPGFRDDLVPRHVLSCD